MIKNEWKEIQKLKTGRAGCGACVAKNNLYTFFGWDHTNTNLKSIEYLAIDGGSDWKEA